MLISPFIVFRPTKACAQYFFTFWWGEAVYRHWRFYRWPFSFLSNSFFCLLKSSFIMIRRPFLSLFADWKAHILERWKCVFWHSSGDIVPNTIKSPSGQFLTFYKSSYIVNLLSYLQHSLRDRSSLGKLLLLLLLPVATCRLLFDLRRWRFIYLHCHLLTFTSLGKLR